MSEIAGIIEKLPIELQFLSKELIEHFLIKNEINSLEIAREKLSNLTSEEIEELEKEILQKNTKSEESESKQNENNENSDASQLNKVVDTETKSDINDKAIFISYKEITPNTDEIEANTVESSNNDKDSLEQRNEEELVETPKNGDVTNGKTIDKNSEKVEKDEEPETQKLKSSSSQNEETTSGETIDKSPKSVNPAKDDDLSSDDTMDEYLGNVEIDNNDSDDLSDSNNDNNKQNEDLFDRDPGPPTELPPKHPEKKIENVNNNANEYESNPIEGIPDPPSKVDEEETDPSLVTIEIDVNDGSDREKTENDRSQEPDEALSESERSDSERWSSDEDVRRRFRRPLNIRIPKRRKYRGWDESPGGSFRRITHRRRSRSLSPTRSSDEDFPSDDEEEEEEGRLHSRMDLLREIQTFDRSSLHRLSDEYTEKVQLGGEEEEKIKQLKEMGFNQDHVVYALYRFNFDIQEAANFLAENNDLRIGSRVVGRGSRFREEEIFVESDGDEWPRRRRSRSRDRLRNRKLFRRRTRRRKKKKKKKKVRKKSNYIPPNTWELNPSLKPDDFEERWKESKKIIDLGQDMILEIIGFCGFRECMNMTVTHSVFNHVINLPYVWNMIVEEKLPNHIKDDFCVYLRGKKLLDPEGNLDKKREYKNEYSQYRQEYVKREVESVMISRIKDQEYDKYHDWENGSKYYICGLFVLTLCVALLILIIVFPLILDQVIPARGFYWLIPYIPFGVVLSPFYILFYIKNCHSADFYPLLFPFEKKEEKEENFDVVISLQTVFLWTCAYFILIGIKVLFFNKEAIWTYMMIPVYIIMFYSALAFSVTFFERYFEKQKLKIYVLSFSIGLFLFNLFLTFSMITVTMKLDGFIGDYWKFFYSAIPLFISVIIFFVAVIIPMASGVRCDYVDTEDYFFDLVIPLIIPIVVSILVGVPIIVTIILGGLRADFTILISYVVCFIPIYVSIGLFLILFCCAGCIALVFTYCTS